MNKKQQTIQAYNNNAETIAIKFDAFDRIKDIEELFQIVDKENPSVLEIGCANGRDATDFVKFTNNYVGLDASEKLLEIAKKRLPGVEFVLADIEDYDLPQGLDIVYASASLIHIDKEGLQKVFDKVYQALNTGGLFRITMKIADEYTELTKDTPYGTRTYYLYSKDDLFELGQRFTVLKSDIEFKSGQNWLEFMYKKV
jgi:SAM-dependent methyltransferase